MDLILDDDFDIDNPGATMRGDYYVRVTRFVSGGLEALMKVVRPMAQAQFGERWQNEFPVSTAPKPEKSQSEIEADKADNQRRAVNHAKKTTRYLVQQMQADRLLTLTYRDCVEDREKVKDDFTRFRRLVKEGWKGRPGLINWRYVAVLELQQRGAYHIHIAVRGWQPVSFLRECWYRALGASIDSKGSETPGAINVTPPRDATGASRKKEWASVRLASYIVKYMAKTFGETSTEKNRYWRSKDIAAPVTYRHWLMATNMEDAINELISHLSFAEQFEMRRHWGSDDGTCYWIQGVCDAP
jgi:hypothetical protein